MLVKILVQLFVDFLGGSNSEKSSLGAATEPVLTGNFSYLIISLAASCDRWPVDDINIDRSRNNLILLPDNRLVCPDPTSSTCKDPLNSFSWPSIMDQT